MSNPNGANQHIPDPRQVAFLANYLDYKSPTFSNCLQSALKAGFSQQYAENLLNLMPKWLSESMEGLDDLKRLKRAEKNLTEVQEIQIVNEEGRPDPQLIEKRNKVDMFLVERLNKAKYSTRQELTGKDGESLPQPLLFAIKEDVSNNQCNEENSEAEPED